MTHTDLSYKDKKYFIDGSVYNCPFCNRRNVSYAVLRKGYYNSSNDKTIYYYIVQCKDHECGRYSLHLSEYDLSTSANFSNTERFGFPPQQLVVQPENSSSNARNVKTPIDIIAATGNKIEELDHVFFFHQPTTFFTIDKRIPLKIREPLSESENCLNNNFLTGASGCLRKATYKLLQHEKITDCQDEKFISHDERIDLLKKKYPKIDSQLFNELKDIHILTSQELHENDWEDFDSNTLRYLLEILRVVLIEMYVTPDETQKRRNMLQELKKKSKPQKNK